MKKPDLIVVDGGQRGQLSKSFNVLKEMKIKDIEMISLAKRIEEAENRFAESLFTTAFARREALLMLMVFKRRGKCRRCY